MENMNSEKSRVRVNVVAWQKVMAANRKAHAQSAADVRNEQYDLCRELIAARGDLSDMGWICFRKTLTPDDRKRLFLVGFDSLSYLEDEFRGEQADCERAAKRALGMVLNVHEKWAKATIEENDRREAAEKALKDSCVEKDTQTPSEETPSVSS
jgi:hypothetical protein